MSSRPIWLLCVISIGILCLGGGATWWAVRQADHHLRTDALDQAQTVARTIDPRLVQALTLSERDQGTPTYDRLKDHLRAIRAQDPRFRFVYLMGRMEDGSIAFVADSEPASSPDCSPPGQLYSEASPACRRAFPARHPEVDGPYDDRWGTWVSPLVPIRDPQTRTISVATPDDAQALVRSAVAYQRNHGQAALLAAINDPQGPFRKGDLYAFAYDHDMTMRAHPVRPELVGKNLIDGRDWVGGKPFRREIRAVALDQGSGWVDYEYRNPASGAIEPKTTYVERSDDLILCAGAYTGTGSVVAVLGMDQDARDWNRTLLQAALPTILATCALLAILVVGWWRWARRAPAVGAVTRKGLLIPGLIVAAGLILTCWGTWVTRSGEERKRCEAFQDLADARLGALATAVETIGSELDGLGRHLEGVDPITTTDFAAYAGGLSRDRAAQAWAWAPIVPAAVHESWMADARADGLAEFTIWQRDAGGLRVAATGRDAYVPVRQIEPRAIHAQALGFDLGSEPIRRIALEQAGRTGLLTGTDPFVMVHEPGSRQSLLAIRPVHARTGPRSLRGFVIAGLRFDELLASTRPDDLVTTSLRMVTADGFGDILAGTPQAGAAASRLVRRQPIHAFGKTFAVTAQAGPAFLRQHPLWSWQLVAVVGCLLTLATALLAHRLRHEHERLEHQVQERTGALAASEARWAFAMEVVGDALWDWDLAANRIRYERRYWDFLGYAPGELGDDPATSFLALLHPDEQEQVQAEIRRHLRGESPQYALEHRLLRKDGSWLWVRSQGKVSERTADGQPTRFIGTTADISLRKSAELALVEEHERLVGILRGTNAGTWEWNVQTGAAVFNERWAEIVGFTLDELAPISIETWIRLVHPEDGADSTKRLHAQFAGETDAYDCECRMRHKDGTWVWVHDRGRVVSRTTDGKPLLMRGTHLDITERKRREEAERELAVRKGLQAGILASLTTEPALVDGDLPTFAGRLTEMVAQRLGISRVGVWLFDETGSALVCVDAFDAASASHASGATLDETAYRSEFAALRQARFINAHDALTDPRTVGYVEGYLKPLGITSMLDGVVRSEGRDLGAVCFELVGQPHRWSDDETAFVCQLCDQIALAIANRDRVQAERALSERETNFRTFFDAMHDLVLVGTAEGRVLYANRAALDTLGYDLGELDRLGVLGLHPADRQQEAADIFAAMFRGERDACPLPVQAKDGRLIPVETRIALGAWSGTPCIFGVIKNLSTEREAMLRFERLFQANPAPMAITALPERRFIEVNEAFERITGHARSSVIGHSAVELGIFEDPEQATRMANALAQDGRVRNVEVTIRRADGEHRTGLFSGEIIDIQGRRHLLTVMLDVTDQRAAAAALTEQEHRLRQLVDGIDAGVVIIDPETHVIESANPYAARLFGAHLDQIAGQVYHRFLCPTADGACPVTDRGLTVDNSERVMLTADGRQAPVLKSVRRITIGGKPKLLETFIDISARKQIEQHLLETNQALALQTALANDMAARAEIANGAKSAFLANMSHEIRTPINGILGMTELILGTSLNAEQEDYARTAYQSAEALLTLLNDILDFSKIDAGKLTLEAIPFDPRQLAYDVVELFRPRVSGSGVEMLVRISPDLPARAIGDPGRWRQILTNLVGNAIKFTSHGHVLVDLDWRDGSYILAVSDTGIGIPADRLTKLFAPFVQADQSTSRHFGGTGLGLAISRRIAELMHGTLDASSVEGQGSTFTARLPLPLDQTPAPIVASPHLLTGLRILVVDDSEVNCRIVCEQMTILGARAEYETNPVLALVSIGAVANTAEPFSAAVIDLHMPVMDGTELATAILGDPATSGLPLILLSSSGARGDAQRMADTGFAGYLVKPARLEVLGGVTATAIERRRTGVPGLVTRHTLREAHGQDVQPRRVLTAPARVLLVDDSLVNQKLARIMLVHLGASVTVAGNGQEALAMSGREPFDLIFMDCQMPVMDGFETTAAIRARESRESLPRQVIIAMTANAMAGDRERCLAAGMDDYLPKPVKERQIAEILYRWLGDDRPKPEHSIGTP